MTRENIVKAPSGRVRRTQLGGRRNILTVEGKESGYHYRIVNDTEDRVEEFKSAGYELVPAKDVKIGEKRVEQTSAEGSFAKFSVGGGVKGVLMRQRDDWYQEDQAGKQAYIDETERATLEDARKSPGRYGKVEVTSSL